MGMFFCKSQQAIGISKACTQRIINEETGELITQEERMMDKLKCMNDTHSKKQGLDDETFNELFSKVQRRLQDKIVPEPPCKNMKALLQCLEKYSGSIIQCESEVVDFIECVDGVRISQIKKHIEQSRRRTKS